jgi:hypothetical protein
MGKIRQLEVTKRRLNNPYFFLVEKGWLTRQVYVVPIAFVLPQVKGIGESIDHSCKVYMKTSPSSFHFFPHQHYS